MRVIILAAGQGYQLDGFNKLLIRHPVDGRRIIDHYKDAFNGKDITIVLGYRAINVMHNYPELKYVFNDDWAVTNNSYSLSMAISDQPSYIISGDLFFNPKLIANLDNAGPNIVATQMRQNRTLSALNVAATEKGNITEVYQGKVRSIQHSEAIGIFKISDATLLAAWRRNCIEHSNLFAGQNIPFDTGIDVLAHDISEFKIHEINAPQDYLRLIEATK